MDISVVKKRRNVYETELMGEITIGAGEARSMTFLSQAIRTFREQHLDVAFRIFSANADNVKERLDMGLFRHGPPLAEQGAVTPQDLEDVPP